MCRNCFAPILNFAIEYTFYDDAVDVELNYVVADYVSYLPRIGLKFALPGRMEDKFIYKGYGPHESYIDKHIGDEYGEYESTAQKEYFRYVRPQESGSHCGSTEVEFDDIKITAENPFSFSVIPYSEEMLALSAHDFELPETDSVYVSLDVAMSGVGTNSCGPELAQKYRAPKKGRNKFRIILKHM